MFNAIGGLLKSRKFWLCAGACVAAGVNGQWWLIPGIIMAEAGLVAAEDCAAKLKTGKANVS